MQQTIISHAVKQRILGVLLKPRLKAILGTMRSVNELKYLLLLDNEKEDLLFSYNYSIKEEAAFSAIEKEINETSYMQICSDESIKFSNTLLPNKHLSLPAKVLGNASDKHKEFIRVYQVPGKLINGKIPKNVVFLNKEPDCYMYNSTIQTMVERMFSEGMFQYLIFSTTAVHARALFETFQIDAIFNADWGRSGMRVGIEDILNALNVNPLGGHKFTNVQFNKIVRSLPCNDEHGDMNGFFESLKQGKRTQQIEMNLF